MCLENSRPMTTEAEALMRLPKLSLALLEVEAPWKRMSKMIAALITAGKWDRDELYGPRLRAMTGGLPV
jgi:hypothetical protein